jgi:hypothetical protein
MGTFITDPAPPIPASSDTVFPAEAPEPHEERPTRAPAFVRDPTKGDRPGQSPEHSIPQPFRIDY